ncbi:hypothetical protein SAMN05216389_1219 [Oceanobacillus limi]|uniref:Uncharacterized protein n=1 Tax=Oceanobacillus limi TaxID=930131 RepID=A0A1I0GE95_9BACI|nr:hypothetical protein [Oceanobacillus limi]SET69168.1 hypothetical protein SAMN05216389_1219 [Oceanobacillus limi]
MAKSTVKVTGIHTTVRRKLTDQTAESDIDKITEAYARKIASEASEKAPILTGLLKNTLVSGVQRSPVNRTGIWEIIAGTDYTLRQEYEHKTHKGFIRRSIWDNEDAYKKAVEKRAKDGE